MDKKISYTYTNGVDYIIIEKEVSYCYMVYKIINIDTNGNVLYNHEFGVNSYKELDEVEEKIENILKGYWAV